MRSRAGGMYAPPVRVVRGSGSTLFFLGGGVDSSSPSAREGGVGGLRRLLSPLSLSLSPLSLSLSPLSLSLSLSLCWLGGGDGEN